MRIPDYLSPTSVSLYYKDRSEFYVKYCADNRLPRLPQTEPMSVGSAFDAYIKNYIADRLGMPEASSDLDLDYLLTTQVEPQNMDFALRAGRDCFDQYCALGAASNLMLELEQAEKVCFEHTVQATMVDGSGMVLLGKPDLYFWADDVLHIYDWKVNGYCSASMTSPNKGYVRMLASGSPTKTHKIAQVIGGIDVANKLEDLNESWATQLAIYGWVLGGRDLVAGIDQLACSAKGVRVASLRNKIGGAFQDELYARCLTVWDAVQTGNVIDPIIASELEASAQAYVGVDDPGYNDHEAWYTDMMRQW